MYHVYSQTQEVYVFAVQQKLFHFDNIRLLIDFVVVAVDRNPANPL